ncbi:hypothetical protein [Paraburkholderia oxyphila]|uniref:hypothetical protein n=1 Tax=Paraburkholderia oxyphila TaxID=614212 RepID=UPI00157B89DA|nr:hypothetical protein [Paraburkholderia oxyphila]
MNQLVKRMVRIGWIFEHGKLRHPAGIGCVTFPRTPSDHRTLLNFRRDIRRLEASLPGAVAHGFASAQLTPPPAS